MALKIKVYAYFNDSVVYYIYLTNILVGQLHLSATKKYIFILKFI